MTRAVAAGLDVPDPVLADELGVRLDQVEAALERSVRSDTDFVTKAASYLLSAGGKRFRPMMVLLSGYFGDPDDPRLVQGACAIELVHLATLYHDDVVDEAGERRGRRSVNANWGNAVAVLTGDFLFARASDIAAELGTEVSKLLARAIALLCDGVIREVEGWRTAGQSVDSYMEMIRRKTAVLIATSARLGGVLGGADSGTTDRLEDLGMAIGMAFQLSDDIMDIIATEEELQKLPGQDMKQGLFTLPVLYALEDERVSGELRDLLAAGLRDGDSMERALDIVRSDGSMSRARQAVTAQVRRARELSGGLQEGRPREALAHFAEFLADRCGANV
jgi:heptaprenyl diphosphate synthase